MSRVLIVDDQPRMRKTIRAVLHDYVCYEAENGQQALEKVRDLKPDLVLLDISMPAMNGFIAAYEIRRLAPRKTVRQLLSEDSKNPSSRVPTTD